MKKGIVFDLDGTLWDACGQIADSWNIYLREKAPDIDKVVTRQEIHDACGLTMTAIGDKIFPELAPDRRAAITEGCCEYEVEYMGEHGGDIYPGFRETLTALRSEPGYHLYVVSNCQKGYIESFLDWAGAWDLFEDIECFGNTGQEKSFNIRLLLDRRNVDLAFYVGDTAGDEKSAGEAGIPFIHAAYGFGTAERPAGVINCLKDLPACVKKLEEDRAVSASAKEDRYVDGR